MLLLSCRCHTIAQFDSEAVLGTDAQNRCREISAVPVWCLAQFHGAVQHGSSLRRAPVCVTIERGASIVIC